MFFLKRSIFPHGKRNWNLHLLFLEFPPNITLRFSAINKVVYKRNCLRNYADLPKSFFSGRRLMLEKALVLTNIRHHYQYGVMY